MLQIISKQDSKIVLTPQTPDKNIDMIKDYIKLSSCENMTVDLTKLNIIDACMVSTVCSTEHYLKYPQGKINWLVNSSQVKEYSADFNLGNSKYSVV